MRSPLPVRSRLPMRTRPTAALALLVLGALGLSACANTVQDEPTAPSALESLVTQEGFPVYWLGDTFRGLPITDVGRDPSGAYAIQYGNCLVGGETVCVTPLQIVTSPDNSFLPGGSAAQSTVLIRGCTATRRLAARRWRWRRAAWWWTSTPTNQRSLGPRQRRWWQSTHSDSPARRLPHLRPTRATANGRCPPSSRRSRRPGLGRPASCSRNRR